MTPVAAGWKRIGLLVLGQTALGLAIVGVFLPLLPTTPFLLLAAYCFLRSSPAAHLRLVKHPVLGRFLTDWQQHRAIQKSVKWTAVLTVIGFATLTCYFAPLNWPLRLVTILGSSVGLIVILRLPVLRPGTVKSPAITPPISAQDAA